MVPRFVVELGCRMFDSFIPGSILGFSSAFVVACHTNIIHEGPSMLLFLDFMKIPLKLPLIQVLFL